MRFDQLRQFIVLAEKGNFKKASLVLGISQPALTRSIQSLEELLQAPLFDRLPGGVVMTEYGKVVNTWARETLNSSVNVKRYIDLLRNVPKGQLIIGTGAYFADSILAEAIGKVTKAAPLLRIQTERVNWKESEAMLVNNQIDLFLGWVNDAAVKKKFKAIKLLSDPIILFCRKNHPILRRFQPGLKEILQYPIAGPKVPDRLQEEMVQSGFGDSGMEKPFLTVEFDAYSEIRKIVETSDCIGGLPETSMVPYLNNGSFVKLPVTLEGLEGQIGITLMSGKTLLPAVNLMVKLLTEIVEDRVRMVQE